MGHSVGAVLSGVPFFRAVVWASWLHWDVVVD
jgi:hypothetical protein